MSDSSARKLFEEDPAAQIERGNREIEHALDVLQSRFEQGRQRAIRWAEIVLGAGGLLIAGWAGYRFISWAARAVKSRR